MSSNQISHLSPFCTSHTLLYIYYRNRIHGALGISVYIVLWALPNYVLLWRTRHLRASLIQNAVSNIRKNMFHWASHLCHHKVHPVLLLHTLPITSIQKVYQNLSKFDVFSWHYNVYLMPSQKCSSAYSKVSLWYGRDVAQLVIIREEPLWQWELPGISML